MNVTGDATRTISSTAVGVTASRSSCQIAPLVGVLRQQVHAVADRGAGGVVAGDREQDEERRDLVRGEHVLAEVVVHERGGEVVGRVRRGAPRPARS